METTIRAGIALFTITLGKRDAIILVRLENVKTKKPKVKKLYLMLGDYKAKERSTKLILGF